MDSLKSKHSVGLPTLVRADPVYPKEHLQKIRLPPVSEEVLRAFKQCLQLTKIPDSDDAFEATVLGSTGGVFWPF